MTRGLPRSTSVHAAAWRLPGNRHLLWGVGASIAVVAALVYVPYFHGAFATVALGPGELALVVGLSLVPAAGIELAKGLARGRSSSVKTT